jgi:hypothetical protein
MRSRLERAPDSQGAAAGRFARHGSGTHFGKSHALSGDRTFPTGTPPFIRPDHVRQLSTLAALFS